MTGGRPHPSRPGESTRATPRVRHRGTGREGRVAEGAGAEAGEILVLFDGAATARSVHPRNLAYLDAAEPASHPGASRS